MADVFRVAPPERVLAELSPAHRAVFEYVVAFLAEVLAVV